jgi:hypothetical protein
LVQQSSRVPSSKGRRQGTNRDLPNCDQALVSKKCGNGKDIFFYGLSTRACKSRIFREISPKGNLKDDQQGTLLSHAD